MADLTAPVTGSVWKIECADGQRVAAGDTLVILESMKMEIPVDAEQDGVVVAILCKEADAVDEGDVLLVVE